MMKTTKNLSKSVFFSFILFMTVFNCQSQETKYLYLNTEQLKTLGIEVSKKGIFYQNCNPNLKEIGYFAFYYLNNGVNATIAGNCDLNPGANHYNIFKNKQLTENDFYISFIGIDEKYNYLHTVNKEKLLPIAISLENTKISNGKGTLLVWFRVTEALKKALPQGTVIEDYLGFPEIKEEDITLPKE